MSIHTLTGIEMLTKVVPSINTHIYRKMHKQLYCPIFHNYVLPFLNAFGTKVVVTSTCIKRRVNV